MQADADNYYQGLGGLNKDLADLEIEYERQKLLWQEKQRETALQYEEKIFNLQ